MAAGDDWSVAEVRRTVADYMDMLQFELTRQDYNKSAHRRTLLSQLAGRTDGAVELKHQNISAVLQGLECFWIPGYKPRGNYQQLLEDEVVAWLAAHPEFDLQARAAAEAPAVVPEDTDFSRFEEAKPELEVAEVVEEPTAPYDSQRIVAGRRDYVGREARNASLGAAGEKLALRYEQERLSRLGHDQLAGRVTHVAAKDDGAGFDILSYEPTGQERFIEVKTTAFAKETPFFASAKEVRFAQQFAPQYHLYRLFRFKTSPRCFILSGRFQQNCRLDPESYRCTFR
ncbi:DUF3883 domain-containing protein [Opitutus sp. ER46]|uniref:DUF3883 domain-containing protein n=1 Tax=Opitutus sp. ER46 TaxID=2161864 RepID=UPI000D2F8E33|nr:DUF3883 domain-containing protein [Opitutus sp. ER46]PTX98519.1 hypothetical protein DB354_04450 [Opitutus sp. ER46]